MGRCDQDRSPTSDERGQILLIAAILLVPLLLVAALAIDLSALNARGQRLQAAADLAALSGAEVRGRGADDPAIAAAVDRALAENGVDLNTVDHSFRKGPGGDVTVELIDRNPPTGLGMIPGDPKVNRAATATTGACLGGCEQTLTFQPDLPPVRATGSGDGFEPLIVGNVERLMSLNHHLARPLPGATYKQLTCVVIATQAPCPGYPMQVDTSTPDNTTLIWDEKRNQVWYTMQKMAADGSRTDIGFGCVDVERAATCAEVIGLTYFDGYDRAQYSLHNLMRGWSTQIARVGDRLYLVGEDLTVTCLDLNTKSLCPGYPKRPPEWVPFAADDQVGFNPTGIYVRHQGDELVIGERLFFTWPTKGKAYVFCWDTTIDGRCADFGERVGVDGVARITWLFQIPDPVDGSFGAVCAAGGGLDIRCNRMDGTSFSGNYLDPGLPLKGTQAFVDSCGDSHRCTGRVFRQARKLFSTSWYTDTVYCVDIYTGQPCGQLANKNYVAYSFTKLPGRNCLLGLGHNSYYFSFSIDDMGPCTLADAEIELFPCACRNGTFHWGRVVVDDALLDRFSRFDVVLTDEIGNVVAGPLDLVSTGGTVDLSDVDPAVERIFMRYSPTLKAGQTWQASFSGTVEVTSRASLID